MDTLNLNKFIDKLVEEKGFDSSNLVYIKNIKEELYSLVEDVINSEVIKNMPKDKIEEFESLFDKNATDQEISQFITGNIANIDQILSDALLNFRTLYLNS